jgi:hypothetical protein
VAGYIERTWVAALLREELAPRPEPAQADWYEARDRATYLTDDQGMAEADRDAEGRG